MKESAGKGLGLFAAKDIPRGTRLIAEKPLFRMPDSVAFESMHPIMRDLPDPVIARLLELSAPKNLEYAGEWTTKAIRYYKMHGREYETPSLAIVAHYIQPHRELLTRNE